jgi:hypothetical protein
MTGTTEQIDAAMATAGTGMGISVVGTTTGGTATAGTIAKHIPTKPR